MYAAVLYNWSHTDNNPNGRWFSTSTATVTLNTVTVLIPSGNIRNHNPQFSRSIIYNVITVRLTGHSSCSPPFVASIKFWLVNDCLFFAGHMESADYSLSLYSHWLTPATDVGTVIVLYCWSAPRHFATHWVVFSKWLQFAILSEDYCKSFLLFSTAERLEK